MSARPEYQLVDTPAAFATAAGALAGGRGPFAVDTERASTYRYGDRAFLVQVRRRGAGTFLIAPEGHRDAARDVFGEVLNGEEWIIHAAKEDLRSLAELGLHPGRLFDTELASRLAGFSRPNLAAMVERFVGVELEKGHGHENWSTTPLPPAWREYAALDVEYLHDLAEALTEYLDASGKLDFAFEEFEHLMRAAAGSPAPKTWRDVKGVSTLRSKASLQVARELWRERDAMGRDTDTSPSRLLSNQAIVEIARAQPTAPSELTRLASRDRMRPRDAARWLSVVERALAADAATWPEIQAPDPAAAPSKSSWERYHHESWQVLQASRASIAQLAEDIEMQPEVLLAPAVLREVIWQAPESGPHWGTHAVARSLAEAGARPWQVDYTAPLIAAAHAAVRDA